MEFWRVVGFERDGMWSESQYEGRLSYFFPTSGKYYLKVTAKSNRKRHADLLYRLSVKQQLGSAELFTFIGKILLGISVICFIWGVIKFQLDW